MHRRFTKYFTRRFIKVADTLVAKGTAMEKISQLLAKKSAAVLATLALVLGLSLADAYSIELAVAGEAITPAAADDVPSGTNGEAPAADAQGDAATPAVEASSDTPSTQTADESANDSQTPEALSSSSAETPAVDTEGDTGNGTGDVASTSGAQNDAQGDNNPQSIAPLDAPVQYSVSYDINGGLNWYPDASLIGEGATATNTGKKYFDAGSSYDIASIMDDFSDYSVTPIVDPTARVGTWFVNFWCTVPLNPIAAPNNLDDIPGIIETNCQNSGGDFYRPQRITQDSITINKDITFYATLMFRYLENGQYRLVLDPLNGTSTTVYDPDTLAQWQIDVVSSNDGAPADVVVPTAPHGKTFQGYYYVSTLSGFSDPDNTTCFGDQVISETGEWVVNKSAILTEFQEENYTPTQVLYACYLANAPQNPNKPTVVLPNNYENKVQITVPLIDSGAYAPGDIQYTITEFRYTHQISRGEERTMMDYRYPTADEIAAGVLEYDLEDGLSEDYYQGGFLIVNVKDPADRVSSNELLGNNNPHTFYHSFVSHFIHPEGITTGFLLITLSNGMNDYTEYELKAKTAAELGSMPDNLITSFYNWKCSDVLWSNVAGGFNYNTEYDMIGSQIQGNCNQVSNTTVLPGQSAGARYFDGYTLNDGETRLFLQNPAIFYRANYRANTPHHDWFTTSPSPWNGFNLGEVKPSDSMPYGNELLQRIEYAPRGAHANCSSVPDADYRNADNEDILIAGGAGLGAYYCVRFKAVENDLYSLEHSPPLQIHIPAGPKLNVKATGAVADNKVYDGTTTATVDLSNADLVCDGDLLYPGGGAIYHNGDSIINSLDNPHPNVHVSLSHYSANFDDKNVGDAKPVSITGLRLGGSDAARFYHLSDTTTLSTANITKKPIELYAYDVTVVENQPYTEDHLGVYSPGFIPADAGIVQASEGSLKLADAAWKTPAAAALKDSGVEPDASDKYDDACNITSSAPTYQYGCITQDEPYTYQNYNVTAFHSGALIVVPNEDLKELIERYRKAILHLDNPDISVINARNEPLAEAIDLLYDFERVTADPSNQNAQYNLNWLQAHDAQDNRLLEGVEDFRAQIVASNLHDFSTGASATLAALLPWNVKFVADEFTPGDAQYAALDAEIGDTHKLQQLWDIRFEQLVPNNPSTVNYPAGDTSTHSHDAVYQPSEELGEELGVNVNVALPRVHFVTDAGEHKFWHKHASEDVAEHQFTRSGDNGLNFTTDRFSLFGVSFVAAPANTALVKLPDTGIDALRQLLLAVALLLSFALVLRNRDRSRDRSLLSNTY